ncbi:4945_t:CDS:2 [Entrophospora sp. SA101]|nr:4945_t:CDS:2 [Entrophospora sp. SA101]
MLKGDKKADHFVKLEELLEEYPSIFIVNVDNVGSNQMQHIRHVLRNKAIILMATEYDFQGSEKFTLLY